MKVCVLIPAYNEEQGIKTTLERVKKVVNKMKNTDFVVVNDGSTDKTAEIVKKMKIKLIDNRMNKGKGIALKNALEKLEYDVFVTTDADCTYEVEKIPDMVKILEKEGADMVVGSRFLGRIEGGMPRLNWLGNMGFSWLVSALTLSRVTDASSGLRAFRSKVKELNIRATGLDFEVELTTLAGKNGWKVVEVPITYTERKGKSKLKPIKDGWRFLKAILRARFSD